MMAAVFAMQGFGILAGSIVTIIFLSIFKHYGELDINVLDNAWRLVIAFGTIPCLIAIYFRLTIPETPRYTLQVENNIDKGLNDVDFVKTGKKVEPLQNVLVDQSKKASFSEFRKYFSKWKNLKLLVATSVCWFALDVGFYGITLNTSIIYQSIGFGGSFINTTVTTNFAANANNFEVIFNGAIGNLIVAVLGLVPGYWVSVGLIEILGRKKIQIIGFVGLSVTTLILAASYDKLKAYSTVWFVIVFTLMQFFQNFGPNTTTFIYPGELFPTRFRSTCHGISAAMGKLGMHFNSKKSY